MSGVSFLVSMSYRCGAISQQQRLSSFRCTSLVCSQHQSLHGADVACALYTNRRRLVYCDLCAIEDNWKNRIWICW